jgi:hypothetical protein
MIDVIFHYTLCLPAIERNEDEKDPDHYHMFYVSYRRLLLGFSS